MMSLFLVAAMAMLSVADCNGTVLALHRRFKLDQSVDIEVVVARDLSRHARITGHFNLSGDVTFAQMYYAKVSLGSPPQEFNVDIDTGSDLSWVSCINCTNCPRRTSLGIQLNYYNVAKSSTGTQMLCSDHPKCMCSNETYLCTYTTEYVDGSETSGYLVSDLLHLPSINQASTRSSSSLLFGCSTKRVENLLIGEEFVDGLFGFGPGRDSVVQQLSFQGITPKIFSLCLRGGDHGGGQLVMGEALHQSIVYTPLVISQGEYSVMLERIAIKGNLSPSASIIYPSNKSQGIHIDSGTTLAFLEETVYDHFTVAISSLISQHLKPYKVGGILCYDMTTSETEFFPLVTLYFAGGASMVLEPNDYLLNRTFLDGSNRFCMGFQRVQDGGVPILGDLVLRDKIVVYDLHQRRLGLSSSFNCSLQLNVTNDGWWSSPRNDVYPSVDTLVHSSPVPI